LSERLHFRRARPFRCVLCGAPATEVALELVERNGEWRCEDAKACAERRAQLALFAIAGSPA
jgi:hypothetical protein